MVYEDADGKKIYSGFIVPNDIHKLARRNAVEVESNEGDELEAEI